MTNKRVLTESRSSTKEVIAGRIAEARMELLKLNQDKILGKLKNYRQIRTAKHNIAQLSTILDEKVRQSLREES